MFKIFYDFRIFCEENDKWPLFGKVVTDFSFVNIHAITKACNSMNLIDYINISYKIAVKECIKPENVITIHLFSKDVNSHYNDVDKGMFIKDLLATCITLKHFQTISDWFFHISIRLGSPCYNECVKKSYEHLVSIKVRIDEQHVNQSEDIFIVNVDDYDKQNDVIYKASPFYKHFKTLTANIAYEKEGPNNPFYNESFLNLISKKYMLYCSLWTGLMLEEATIDRVSNCYVENYFHHLKWNILVSERNLKPSRFLRKCRKNVLAMYTEVAFKIPKSAQTCRQKCTNQESDERFSQETWSRRRKATSTHFSGRFLKESKLTLPDVPKQTKLKVEDDIFDIENCLYCNAGRLQETADWVQCDQCFGWIHQKCVSDTQKSFSGQFTCMICDSCGETLGKVERLASVSDNKVLQLRDACKSAKEINGIDEVSRSNLEVETTRDQRLSVNWFLERRKRLTSSNFGRICKAQTVTSKINISKNLLLQKNITNITAVKYGIETKSDAIRTYMKENNCVYKKCGLILHPQYLFLAGSPDGLLNEDDLLEVKFPFKAKIIQFQK